MFIPFCLNSVLIEKTIRKIDPNVVGGACSRLFEDSCGDIDFENAGKLYINYFNLYLLC